MANYKKSVSKSKKIVKKVRKSKHKKLIFVVFFLVLIVVAFFGFMTYKENSAYNSFRDDVNAYLEFLNIPNELDSDYELPKSDKYELEWKSSDDKVFNNLGKISRPSYEEGDKTVNLVLTIKYNGTTFMYSALSGVLSLENITKTYKIKVTALPPTAIEKCNEVKNALNMANMIYDRVTFPSETYYNDVSISWESSNTSVLKNNGEIIRPSVDTLVTIRAYISSDTDVVTKEFEVLVLANELEISENDDDFDALDATHKYESIKSGLLTYTNALVFADPDFGSSGIDDTETNNGSNLDRKSVV